MKTLKILSFSVFVMLQCVQAAAQQKDSINHLQEVIIEQSRLDQYAIGHYTLSVDSITQKLAGTSNLADMLRIHGYGHMRGYGLGGLTTPSFRGTGSSHTAILWNGINLQGALNGQSDLIQVPITFVDDVQIQMGGSASLYGSGAIGGTLHLNSRAQFGEGLKIRSTTSIGSFDNHFNDFSLTWSGQNFITSTKLFRNNAQNDFPFYNENTRRQQKREYTAVSQVGILQQTYWQFLPNHQLNMKFWYQDNTIEVPNPTTVPRKPDAEQQDEFYRAVLAYQYERTNFNLQYQGSYYHHMLDFYDHANLPQIDSKSIFDTFIHNIEGQYTISQRWDATAGINYTGERGEVDEFGSNSPERHRTAFVAAVKYNENKWKGVFSVRQEIISGYSKAPVAPSLGVEYDVSSQLRVTGNASRNYRIPTFNDLFWVGAGAKGNPSLSPETSWSNELGLRWSTLPGADIFYMLRVNGFTSVVDNWILWANTNQVWSPENVKEVWSRGIEANIFARCPIGNVRAEFNILYSFTKSTTEDSYTGYDNELHKQLSLTPQHEGNSSLQLLWKRYELKAIYNYTGKQYTDDGNDEYFAMKSYAIASAWLTRDFVVKQFRAELTGQINNAFDKSYESRPGYPLPGRNFKVALTLFFQKPIKS